MDPVSQAALGAACSQVFLFRQDKKNAWLIGALAGMAADLDILIRSSSDPMLIFIYHRHFTHSLAFIPIGGLLVALALLPFKRFRTRWLLTLSAALIGYATHGILDAMTSYGTVLFWPFSNCRIAWDLLPIIDPFVTVPLVCGVLWTQLFADLKGVLLALGFMGLLLMFNGWQHHRAITAVEAYGRQQHWHLTRIRAFPEIASSTHWYAAAHHNQQIFLAAVHTSPFSSSKVYALGLFPAFAAKDMPVYLSETGKLSRDLRVFNWFTDGYLIVACRQPFTVADARYITGNPVYSLWGIQLRPNRTHAEMRHSIPLKGC
ncbi:MULTISPECIES: metal-dependent hydrolase [Legionella]|uniref:Metal-dependent hydrolase n=1 Tax=Legionella septentrionalis TaxID=2498109 RepID=A0A433JMD0_9GAMM|nr:MULTISPECIES: metal-dependent hydrolase [Legionella]MCP0913065.1 metal-dependent hydrolase [Legionella sp. 27cVA30]RUQ91518.1 metal-dependent hydrolase [Legionella septentrionalis]RUQ98479.1 metal-dependent hydrolase [Legionella septentrionalis]RUR14604.1 metal-dependent hydrolase [Legionella septentrionalis]